MRVFSSILLLLVTSFAMANPYDFLERYYGQFESSDSRSIDRMALESLLAEADLAAARNPESLEYKTASAVIRAGLAKVRGVRGLGDLRQARNLLEDVIEADAGTMNGFATALLARLYSTVPGWPVSFGDKDHAYQLFQLLYPEYPDSLPVVYYKGLFESDQGNDQAALALLKKAQRLPDFCECTHWMEIMRNDIALSIADVKNR